MVVRKRLDIKGPQIVFVTTTVFNWQPILTKANVIEVILSEFQISIKYFDISLLGYVIMPSHLHALLGFPKIETLSQFMKAFKSITSRKVKSLDIPELSSNEFNLWKPRFDDLIVVSEEQFKIKLEYIHNNPVKAGHIREATDWKYSSAIDWMTDNRGALIEDKSYSFQSWKKGAGGEDTCRPLE